MALGTAKGRETMNECMHATVRELFVSDSVKVYRCANCEETLVAILLVQMGESKLWQQAMPVKQLKAENARLTAELAAVREALGLRDYCNTCGKVQPVAQVYGEEGPYGTYCAICNNSIGSHGDPPF